jgi:hypothetical protein
MSIRTSGKSMRAKIVLIIQSCFEQHNAKANVSPTRPEHGQQHDPAVWRRRASFQHSLGHTHRKLGQTLSNPFVSLRPGGRPSMLNRDVASDTYLQIRARAPCYKHGLPLSPEGAHTGTGTAWGRLAESDHFEGRRAWVYSQAGARAMAISD